MGLTEDVVVRTDSLSLLGQDALRWVVYRFEGKGKPAQEDLDEVLKALGAAAAGTSKPVCVVPGDLKQPNSRALGALLGLLRTKDGGERRVALAAPTQAWLDMLDIMGVRSSFFVVDDPGELTSSF